jgi:hypothetical protein
MIDEYLNTVRSIEMDMSLKQFEPGIHIEIDDVMHGFRKLVLVTESGDMYFDLMTADTTPFPIYEALNPVAVGNALSWALELAEQSRPDYDQFTALQKRALDSGFDTLTISRSLYWAYQNRSYDYVRALQAGKDATALVASSRGTMDRLIHKAAAA